ncbi:MAG: EamA family transporter, partial [Spirochaetales bacterium]|nr:EamA family transporter [Spirochaetales bacterium]
LNFAGYILVLKAFAAGSISLVQPIFALSILIPIFLSAFIYKEKVTLIRIWSIGLSLAAVLLIKNG